MIRTRMTGLWIAVGLALVFACGPKPPAQEMTDAQSALEAARQAGADRMYLDEFKDAEDTLNKALAKLREKKYDEARQLAGEARTKADRLSQKLKEMAAAPVEPPVVEPKPEPAPPPGMAPPTIGVEGRVLTPGEMAIGDDSLVLKRVYFEYDDYALTEDAKATLQENSRWLTDNPNVRIQIEGHCDERGTNEYNLALGERRATIVRDYLLALGVAPSRLTVISFGEEVPMDLEHTEEAWQRNRRVQFVYLGE